MTKKINQHLLDLVAILNDGAYHDGNSIGEQLGMTRSAVWKLIQKLISLKIEIHSVKGKGYILQEPLILLDQNKIKKNLSHADFDLHLFESVDSTNDYLKKIKSQEIKFCLAEQQLKGKGRFNRVWSSPFGKNIYLSCLYPLQKDISELSGLSMVAGLAILKTIRAYPGLTDSCVKWPNDILFAGKKISGCLVEIQAETHGSCQVVIGMGINVNMLDTEDSINQAWTSMQSISQTYIDRNSLCANLINNLLAYLQKFNREGLKLFVDEWNVADHLYNKIIQVKNLENNLLGRMLGINHHGHLLLELENGRVHSLASGETSILK